MATPPYINDNDKISICQLHRSLIGLLLNDASYNVIMHNAATPDHSLNLAGISFSSCHICINMSQVQVNACGGEYMRGKEPSVDLKSAISQDLKRNGAEVGARMPRGQGIVVNTAE